MLMLRRIVLALATLHAASLLAACGEDAPLSGLTGGKKNDKSRKKPKPDGKDTDSDKGDAEDDPVVEQPAADEGPGIDTDGENGAGVGEDGDGIGKIVKTIDNSGANFQAKDVTLLKSSVESCMGVGMTAVQDTMLLPELSGGATAPQTADAEGRLKFLLPKKYAAGQDVIDREASNLVDTSGGARTGIAADSLTDTYLRALETIGNVVAHNCDAAKEECKCATKDDAFALLKRCLPGLDPETVEMNESAQALSAVCAQGPGGMRTAIASFIASYAFANAR
jgi:hypothetical protein